jgi:HEAT repeat protein
MVHAAEPLIALLNEQNKLLEASQEIQSLLVKVLCQTQDPRVLEPLVAYWQVARQKDATGHYAAFRWALIEHLPHLDDPRVCTLVAPLARAEDWAAVRVLGHLGDPAAFEVLLEIIHHSEGFARQDAVRSLGYLSHPQAVEILIQIIQNEQEHLAVRVAAAQGLGKQGNPRAIAPLNEILKSRGSNEVHTEARKALEILASSNRKLS